MRWAVMNVNEVFSEDFLGEFLFRAVYNAIPCVDSFFLVNGDSPKNIKKKIKFEFISSKDRRVPPWLPHLQGDGQKRREDQPGPVLPAQIHTVNIFI